MSTLPAPHTSLLHRKKTWVILLVLACLAAGIATLGGSKKHSADAETRSVTVEKGNIEAVVTAQGKLEPKEYVDVGTQVSGQLKTLHFDIGDDVKKGELLAEIDPRLYEAKMQASSAELKSLKAQLAEQQANLVLAQKQQARNAQLIKTQAISKDAMDISTATLRSAEAHVNTQLAQIEQTQSSLEGDKTNLEYTKIYAPMDGTIVSMPARAGQTLNANQTAPTILQLANLDIMTIRATVAEADVMRLKEGMPVHFTTLGSQERSWKGTVRQILPSPEVINDVVLYNVLIDVENKERQLMNGMSTQVFFELGSAKDVLTLPIDALGARAPKEDNDTGKAYRVQAKGAGEVVVHVGLMDRTSAEITDGLKEGDDILLPTRKSNTNTKKPQIPRGMGPPL